MIENNNNNIQHTVIQTYGYTEMYEWMNNPEDIDNQGCGMFVQFTKQEPEKIEPYDGSGVFCGVTTATAQDTSDNPSEWHKKYVVNEYDREYEFEEVFYSNLKRIRKSKDMTRQELADKSTTSINMIIKYENGERDIDKSTLDTLTKLAIALNVNLVDILEDDALKRNIAKCI